MRTTRSPQSRGNERLSRLVALVLFLFSIVAARPAFADACPGNIHLDGHAAPADAHVECSHLDIWVNGQSKATISGHAHELVIQLVDGQSVLDLGALIADSIVVAGKVDGQSRLLLRSTPTGSVTFVDKIDGQASVAVLAAGAVTFGSKIDGASGVTVYAGDSVTGPEVNGASRVWVGRLYGAYPYFHFNTVDHGAAVVLVP